MPGFAPLFGFFNPEGKSLDTDVPQLFIREGLVTELGEPTSKMVQLFTSETAKKDFESKLKIPIFTNLLSDYIAQILDNIQIQPLDDDIQIFSYVITSELTSGLAEKIYLNEDLKSDYLSEPKIISISASIKNELDRRWHQKQSDFINLAELILKDIGQTEFVEENAKDFVTEISHELENVQPADLARLVTFYPFIKLGGGEFAIDVTLYDYYQNKPEDYYVDRYLLFPLLPQELLDYYEYLKYGFERLVNLYLKDKII